jgi:hypothetical protein
MGSPAYELAGVSETENSRSEDYAVYLPCSYMSCRLAPCSHITEKLGNINCQN